jgi:hypothetical protein
MTYRDSLANPPWYSHGRRFQPIKVIEDWGLCHHLGCAVKYLARLGQKSSVVDDLLRIEWYLEREFNLHPQCISLPMAVHPYTTDEVIEDWNLSLYPGEVLYHLKASRSPAFRSDSLDQALCHLRRELALYNLDSGERL